LVKVIAEDPHAAAVGEDAEQLGRKVDQLTDAPR
jgi:hypothetical protein